MALLRLARVSLTLSQGLDHRRGSSVYTERRRPAGIFSKSRRDAGAPGDGAHEGVHC